MDIMVVLAHSFPLAVQASVLGEWGYSALFVVSGYVLSYGKAELSIQMARRYVRLYFPMYTACAFAWLLQCYSYSEADLGTRMGWFAEIGHLHVFVPGWYPNLVTWTMPYELYAPLVVAVLKGARGRLGTKWVLTMMVLIAISDTTFNGIMFGSMACVLGTQTEEKLHTWVLALVGFCAMVVYVPTSNQRERCWSASGLRSPKHVLAFGNLMLDHVRLSGARPGTCLDGLGFL